MTESQKDYAKLPEMHVVGRLGSFYSGAVLGACLVLLTIFSIYAWHQRTKGVENAGH